MMYISRNDENSLAHPTLIYSMQQGGENRVTRYSCKKIKSVSQRSWGDGLVGVHDFNDAGFITGHTSQTYIYSITA